MKKDYNVNFSSNKEKQSNKSINSNKEPFAEMKNKETKMSGDQQINNDNNTPDEENDMESRKNKEKNKVDEKSINEEQSDQHNGNDKSKDEQNEADNENEQAVNEETMEDIRDEKFLELQARFDELNDRYLRLFSEFDNFRKRTINEKLELTKNASEDLIKSLLPVIDDIDRALESANNDSNQEVAKEGIELILNKFKTILRQKGLEEIKALGEEFNTDLHEAVSNVAAEKDKDKGKVVDVIQKGYLLNDKVLRYAKVVVAN